MKTRKYLFCLLLLASLLNVSCHDDDDNSEETCASSSPSDYPVVRCGQIIASTGFGMGVDDSQQNRSWALVTAERLRMQYLGEFSWGAVFLTVGGDPVNPPRPSYDFSQYTRMAIEMKGASGNECVQIGMKDANDPDDGSETKIPVRSPCKTSVLNTFSISSSAVSAKCSALRSSSSTSYSTNS